MTTTCDYPELNHSCCVGFKESIAQRDAIFNELSDAVRATDTAAKVVYLRALLRQALPELKAASICCIGAEALISLIEQELK